MSQRRISRQQGFRIDRIQAERIARGAKREARADAMLSSGALGAEQTGRIIAHYGVQLAVEALDGELAGQHFRCHRRSNIDALVTGDRVIWQPATGEQTGVITALLPRDSVLVRPDPYGKLKPVAANIDLILLIIAPEPTPSPELIDRYLIACETTGIRPVIVLNKADLLTPKQHDELGALLTSFSTLGYETRTLSAHGDTGDLRALVAGQTVVFVGQSGVGKSSLINTLLPNVAQRVHELSTNSKLGQHTTTTACWFDLPEGGALIDSPGIREFGVWHMDKAQLLTGFIEFQPFLGQCRFRNCTHEHEPGCALQEAVDNGHVQQRRLTSFQRLVAAHEAMPVVRNKS